MIINRANLDAVRTGFSTAFKAGLGMSASQYGLVATTVSSSTKQQDYGWLGKFPRVREWLGARAVQNLMEHSYSIREKKFELTIAVDRDDIETDNIGVYTPLFQEMGASTTAFSDELVFQLLAAGFATDCYDGQSYFDTDHPVLDEAGAPTTVSNFGGGAGDAWYLMDLSRPLKPIILQKRKDFSFVAKDKDTDDNVFDQNEFVYGSDARLNVGFGFWQIAYASKDTLDADAYAAARAALTGMKGDYGRPLGIRPTHLVVPPTLESAGRKILNSELGTGGETNEWKGTAELAVVPWLA